MPGHEVTLLQAATRPGGSILVATPAPWRRNMIGIVDWLAGEVDHSGVDVRNGVFVAGDDVARLDADSVTVAMSGGGRRVLRKVAASMS